MNKLKWHTDKKSHQTSWEKHEAVGTPFTIEVRKVQHLKRYMFTLLHTGVWFGYFKKLSTAKKVAQLIHNG